MNLFSLVALLAGVLLLVVCDTLDVDTANAPQTRHIGSSHPKSAQIEAAVRRTQDAYRRRDWRALYRAIAPSVRKDRIWILARTQGRRPTDPAIGAVLNRYSVEAPSPGSDTWALPSDHSQAEAIFSELMEIRVTREGLSSVALLALASQPLINWVHGDEAQVCLVPPGTDRNAPDHTWVWVRFEEDGWYSSF